MFRRIAALFEYLFRNRRLEEDLDEELRSSFEMIVDGFMARGMSPVEARRAARMEFEGLERVKENVRGSLAGASLQTLFQDAQYAWRGLRRRPARRHGYPKLPPRRRASRGGAGRARTRETA